MILFDLYVLRNNILTHEIMKAFHHTRGSCAIAGTQYIVEYFSFGVCSAGASTAMATAKPC